MLVALACCACWPWLVALARCACWPMLVALACNIGPGLFYWLSRHEVGGQAPRQLDCKAGRKVGHTAQAHINM